MNGSRTAKGSVRGAHRRVSSFVRMLNPLHDRRFTLRDRRFLLCDRRLPLPEQFAAAHGKLTAHAERFLDRLGRPIDLCVSDGKLYVVEYCRQNETAGPGSEGSAARAGCAAEPQRGARNTLPRSLTARSREDSGARP